MTPLPYQRFFDRLVELFVDPPYSPEATLFLRLFVIAVATSVALDLIAVPPLLYAAWCKRRELREYRRIRRELRRQRLE